MAVMPRMRFYPNGVVLHSPGFAVKPRTQGFAVTLIRTPTGFNDCACIVKPRWGMGAWVWRYPGCAALRRTLGFGM